MDKLRPLLGTTVVLVAHPDDEVIAFGALMQHMKRAFVIFATDGAPRDEYFWKQCGSREAYAEVRRREAREALAIVGAQPVFLVDHAEGGIADQELFRRLPEAIHACEAILARLRPDCLLTLAYEGGHPDHDACCFIASRIGRHHNIPVWESPLYHRDAEGGAAAQKFPALTGLEIEFSVEDEALQKKLRMFHTYQSQKLVLEGFRPAIERFRPMADYDFTRRPLPWKLNYEIWQWPMSGEAVAAEFASYLCRQNPPGTQSEVEVL